MIDQQHQILKQRRQLKNTRFQKQLLESTVKKMLSKRNDTNRLMNRRRFVQCIEITNIDENINESSKTIDQYNLGIDDDILNQSNDTSMEVIPFQTDSQEETFDRKLSFFQRLGTFSGSFFKTLNTNKSS